MAGGFTEVLRGKCFNLLTKKLHTNLTANPTQNPLNKSSVSYQKTIRTSYT